MTEQIFNQSNELLTKDVFVYHHHDRDLVGDVWTKYHTGATAGLLGGLMVFLSAVLIMAFEYFSGEKSHTLWLFLTGFALFAIGAHCLDKISDLKKQTNENDNQNS